MNATFVNMHATFANTHKKYYVTSYQEENHTPSDPGHETKDSQFFLSFEDYKKVNIWRKRKKGTKCFEKGKGFI